MTDQELRDAKASALYELARIISPNNPLLGKYIEDMGRAYQANDAKGFLKIKKMIESSIKSDV